MKNVDKVVTERKCSKCKVIKPMSMFYKNKHEQGGFQYVCKECFYSYQVKSNDFRKEWNRKHKESLAVSVKKWYLNNKDKAKAHNLLYKEIKNGNILRKPCIKCGDINSQGHHFDYSKPLEVIWLCRKHHKQIHGYRIMEET